ncbi:hypothetical protein [Aestuariivivens sediminis]|uniref:hypothetical protein n=1 Tax=Aestuariivivens sediminis TaxID=2913557 RepID=UPI001F57801D|nr:hypothetical protein [Aestuariivivens sediminis]
MILISLLLFFGLHNPWPPTIGLALKNRVVNERLPSVSNASESDRGLTLVFKTDLDATSYTAAKADVNQLRKKLNERHRKGHISLDRVKAEFTTHLVDRIIPHWYGTPWSFEGHTAVPKQGEIACGYFISTTLRDMGINLNRYKLAQKSPIDEARTISCGTVIHSVVQDNTVKAFEEIDQLTEEGLYFIGFDKGHVGYLLKRNNQLSLIHSNYFSPGLVCMEPFKESRVFQSFSKFHIVDISNNKALIQHWLNNATVLP